MYRLLVVCRKDAEAELPRTRGLPPGLSQLPPSLAFLRVQLANLKKSPSPLEVISLLDLDLLFSPFLRRSSSCPSVCPKFEIRPCFYSSCSTFPLGPFGLPFTNYPTLSLFSTFSPLFPFSPHRQLRQGSIDT
jgi:hypothetical protein